MECTKCHMRKHISEFSLKNVKEEIYYLYCDECRKQATDLQQRYKEKAKEDYEIKKLSNIINCDCGKTFVCFRDFHMSRHLNSKYHKNFIKSTNRCIDPL